MTQAPVTWEENLWFTEFIHELEYAKGFYLPNNFKKWYNQVERKIEQIKGTNWTVEKLSDSISL